MKHAIFGDIAGHFGPFKKGLKSLGVDMKSLKIPEGLIIVQVGDLVHKGPNSHLVVAAIDELMANNPGQWIQLAGNHELPYLIDHNFFYNDVIDEETAAILVRWKKDGLIHPSYAFTAASGEDYLVTHAGLTRPNYIDLGEGSAEETNTAIRATDWNILATAGCMLDGRYPNNAAGVFWAESVSEVYASWYNAPTSAPFHQIHGHTSLRLWSRSGMLRFNYAPWIRESLESYFDTMTTVFNTGGRNFYAVDCGLERKAFTKEIPYLLVE